MNREAVIEFVLEHYKAENHGRVDYDECFGDHLECLSDDSLLACLASCWNNLKSYIRARSEEFKLFLFVP